MGIMDVFSTKYYAYLVVSDETKRCGMAWGFRDKAKACDRAKLECGLSRDEMYSGYSQENGYLAYARGSNEYGESFVGVGSSSRSRASAEENAKDACISDGATSIERVFSAHSEKG